MYTYIYMYIYISNFSSCTTGILSLPCICLGFIAEMEHQFERSIRIVQTNFLRTIFSKTMIPQISAFISGGVSSLYLFIWVTLNCLQVTNDLRFDGFDYTGAWDSISCFTCHPLNMTMNIHQMYFLLNMGIF